MEEKSYHKEVLEKKDNLQTFLLDLKEIDGEYEDYSTYYFTPVWNHKHINILEKLCDEFDYFYNYEPPEVFERTHDAFTKARDYTSNMHVDFLIMGTKGDLMDQGAFDNYLKNREAFDDAIGDAVEIMWEEENEVGITFDDNGAYAY